MAVFLLARMIQGYAQEVEACSVVGVSVSGKNTGAN